MNGYDFKKLIASWNVEDTDSKILKEGLIEVSKDEAFSEILYSCKSDELDQTGESQEEYKIPSIKLLKPEFLLKTQKSFINCQPS